MTNSYVIGIDIGGTFIKGGVVAQTGEIVKSGKIPTPPTRKFDEVTDAVAELINQLKKEYPNGITGVGVACPGAVDSGAGIVKDSSNLQWKDAPLRKSLEEKLGCPVGICNDADAALLAELKFGAAKGTKDAILLTLGTGIGSGVFKDGKLLEGVELGHAVLAARGRKCACGRKGCFEAYGSATGLIRSTKEAIRRNATAMSAENQVTGETAFAYYDKDEIARKVIGRYATNLICGIANCANIFRTEVVLLGGGICPSLARFLPEMEQKINAETAFPIRLALAAHGNHAGVLGAAALTSLQKK